LADKQGDYQVVFSERGGRAFLSALWKQWDAERAAFVSTLQRQLELAHSSGEVSRLEADKVIRQTSPGRTALQVQRWLHWAMPEVEGNGNGLGAPVKIGIPQLCSRLVQGNVHPTIAHDQV